MVIHSKKIIIKSLGLKTKTNLFKKIQSYMSIFVLYKNIFQAFIKMNINKMTPIQQNSFLHLMNHHNIAMIGYSKGKSTCYLASIFSLIMNSNKEKMVSLS